MTIPGDPASRLRETRPRLLAWYDDHGRDLPWRRTRDPYRVWVSEVMLQQTRVATVVPYYRAFVRRFPDLKALAGSDEDAVLAAWTGLGYYRRARMLRAGAVAVMERHGGRVPEDPESLRALPGVGRYTAGAIASIAFDRAEPVVDGNVRRVLSRVAGDEVSHGSRTATDRAMWELATGLVDGPRPGDLNQAIMELGARICTPSNPECGSCPLAAACAARATGDPEAYPPRVARRRPTRVRVAVAVVRRGRRVLLARSGHGSPLRGRWDLPAVEIGEACDGAVSLATALADRYGLEIAVLPGAVVADHGIMDRTLVLEAHPATHRRGRTAGHELRWIDPADLGDVPVSGATTKILRGTGPA